MTVMEAHERGHWSERPRHWGRELRSTVGSRQLNPIVECIRAVTGDILGSSRTTYALLYELERAPEPNTREYERAYMLLLAVGQDPADWDIDESQVWPLVRGARDLLLVRSGCTWTKTAA